MFNTKNSENQTLFSGTHFRPNKGMRSPPPSGVLRRNPRPARDKTVGAFASMHAQCSHAVTVKRNKPNLMRNDFRNIWLY